MDEDFVTEQKGKLQHVQAVLRGGQVQIVICGVCMVILKMVFVFAIPVIPGADVIVNALAMGSVSAENVNAIDTMVMHM